MSRKFLKIDILTPAPRIDQIVNLIHGILMAENTFRDLYLPKYYPNVNENKTVLFSDILDIDFLNSGLKEAGFTTQIYTEFINDELWFNPPYLHMDYNSLKNYNCVCNLFRKETHQYLNIGWLFIHAVEKDKTIINQERTIFKYIKFKNHSKEKYYLTMIAQIKNEEMIIEEWIQHYLWQGVERFFIIDNGSTDRTAEIIKSHPEVEYFYRPEKHTQAKNTQEIYTYIKDNNLSTWVIIADADEYIFGLKKPLVNVIKDQPEYVWSIVLPWHLFGSQIRIEKQPISIRKGIVFTDGKITNDSGHVKSIHRVAYIDRVGYHLTADIIYPHFIFEVEELQLNHYQSMSYEYWVKVKCSRGDASGPVGDGYRTPEVYHWYNCNCNIKDEILSKLVDSGYPK